MPPHSFFRAAAFSFAVVLSCGAASAAEDLVAARTARSLIAEAAMVLRLNAESRLTAIYSDAMSENVRQKLQQLEGSTDDPMLRKTLETAVAALTRSDAATLRAIADRLFAQTGPHGPAD
jgi:hypothetical protein